MKDIDRIEWLDSDMVAGFIEWSYGLVVSLDDGWASNVQHVVRLSLMIGLVA